MPDGKAELDRITIIHNMIRIYIINYNTITCLELFILNIRIRYNDLMCLECAI